MARFHVEVKVVPRATLLDPQGQAVEHALSALGFPGVERVRVGRLLTLDLEASDAHAAREAAQGMCERLLANPVTEDFSVGLAAGD